MATTESVAPKEGKKAPKDKQEKALLLTAALSGHAGGLAAVILSQSLASSSPLFMFGLGGKVVGLEQPTPTPRCALPGMRWRALYYPPETRSRF